MATNQTLSSAALLEQQKKRHADLAHRRTLAQGQLEAEKRALEEARAEARREFGTDDLSALRALYEKTLAENDEAVVGFMLSLDEIEQAVATVEKQLAG